VEADGYTLPESMWPDVSEGRIFARWLREEKGLDTDSMPTYTITSKMAGSHAKPKRTRTICWLSLGNISPRIGYRTMACAISQSVTPRRLSISRAFCWDGKQRNC
jgi:hypothetical protein